MKQGFVRVVCSVFEESRRRELTFRRLPPIIHYKSDFGRLHRVGLVEFEAKQELFW